MVGFGTSGYQTDQFDNLSVTPAAGSTGGGEHRPDHRRRRQRQVRGRQRRVQRGRHQDPAVGLQRRRQPAVDRRIERHPAGLRQVHGHHRRQLQQRHADRAVGLQRRRQPAMAGQQRRTGQPRLGQVPGRPQLQHRQRHPARPVDLQRRHQPASGASRESLNWISPDRAAGRGSAPGRGGDRRAGFARSRPGRCQPVRGAGRADRGDGGRHGPGHLCQHRAGRAGGAPAVGHLERGRAPGGGHLPADRPAPVHQRGLRPERPYDHLRGRGRHRDERLCAGDRVDAAEPGEQHLGGQRRHRREFPPAVRQRRRGAAGCDHRFPAPISPSPRPG